MNLLCRYFSTLLEQGRPIGIIADNDTEVLFVRHIVDSLNIFRNSKLYQTLLTAEGIFDIGSGGGLPGIPVAIATNNLMTLVDSSMKRTDFLSMTLKQLSIEKIQVRNMFIGHNRFNHPNSGDVILFRAFRKPLVSLELALYIAKDQSKMLYWHTNKLEKNVKDFDQFRERTIEMGYTKMEYFPLDFPEEYGERGLYFFEFNRKPESKYPRKIKIIEKDSFSSSFS